MNINFNQFTKKICVESLVTWSLFSILIPPTYSESLVLWVSTLATCQAHRVRSIYLASFFFFLLMKTSQMQLLIAGRSRMC